MFVLLQQLMIFHFLNFLQSFMEMIQSKSKIIFILPPGMIAYLKQNSAQKDGVCHKILRAIEVIQPHFFHKQPVSR